MIDDNTNTVYQCSNFFNEKRDHFICKNHKLKLSTYIVNDFFHNRNYLSLSQNMMSSCQKKKFKFFIFRPTNAYKTLLRHLDFIDYNIKKHFNYNNKSNRKLDYLQNIQETIIIYEKISFKKNKSEFLFKYESKEKLKKDNLILIINPKNNQFFGEICLSQNIAWLINNEFNLINCYFVDINNPFSLKIELKQEVINEKDLYIYIKGKLSGTLELFDLNKNKTLNISSSYYIPFIDNFPEEYKINFILPKVEEDIYLHIIINDYGFNEDKNISSIFEIYDR